MSNSNVSPGLNTPNDPNFLYYSRGTWPTQPNLSGAKAIEGISNIFGDAVQATDTTIKRGINIQAQNAVDALNQQATQVTEGKINDLVHNNPYIQPAIASPAAGNPGATTVTGNPQQPPILPPGASTSASSGAPSVTSAALAPSGGNASAGGTASQATPAQPPAGSSAGAQIGNSLQSLDMLKTGAIQKTVSQSYFNAQLLATVQQLRSQYPGYRDYIDQEIGKLTGVVPANALRETLLNELADRQSQIYTLNKDWLDRKQADAQYLAPLHPDLFTNPYWDTYQGRTQLMTEAGGIKARAYSLEQARNGLTFNKMSREEQQFSAEQTMIQDFNDTTNTLLNGALNTAGVGSLTDLQNKVTGLAGKPMSPDDLANVDGALNQMSIKLQQSLRDKANQPLADGKNTYSTLINDPAKINARIAEAMKPIEILRDAIHNPQSGMLALAGLQIKAAQDNNMLAYQKANPWVANIQSLKTAIGDMAMPSVLSGNQGLLPAIINSVNIRPGDAARIQNDQVGALVGQNSQQSLAGDTVSHASIYATSDNPKGSLSGDTIKARVQAAVNMLVNPAVPDNIRANQIRYIFGNDPTGPGQSFLSQFKSPQDQMTLFNQLTSKPVTDQIKKLKDNGDMQSFQAYEQWATNNATRLFAPQIADISSLMKNPTSNVQIGFDDKNMRFVFTTKSTMGAGITNATDIVKAQQQLTGINQMISKLVPIYEAGGQSVPQELAAILNTVGVNPNQPVDTKTGAQKLMEAIQNIIPKGGHGDPNLMVPKGDLNGGSGSLDLNAAQPQVLRNQMPTTSFAPGAAGFRDFIGKAEGAGYNTAFGGDQYPLTQMTINQVLGLQEGLKHIPGSIKSSAVGKNQIVQGTLAGLKESMGLSGNELFDENMQDRMHDKLLEQSGLGYLQQAIKSGNAATVAQAKERFADNLAGVWASLPLANGKSRYEGLNGNSATVDRPTLMAAIDRLITQEAKK